MGKGQVFLLGFGDLNPMLCNGAIWEWADQAVVLVSFEVSATFRIWQKSYDDR